MLCGSCELTPLPDTQGGKGLVGVGPCARGAPHLLAKMATWPQIPGRDVSLRGALQPGPCRGFRHGGSRGHAGMRTVTQHLREGPAPGGNSDSLVVQERGWSTSECGTGAVGAAQASHREKGTNTWSPVRPLGALGLLDPQRGHLGMPIPGCGGQGFSEAVARPKGPVIQRTPGSVETRPARCLGVGAGMC